jgi:hypothetical protein
MGAFLQVVIGDSARTSIFPRRFTCRHMFRSRDVGGQRSATGMPVKKAGEWPMHAMKVRD